MWKRLQRPIEIAAVALLALPLAAQEIDGHVLGDSSGEPLASVELRFHKAGVRELAADLETERDGRFHAAGLAAGEYTVDISKPNFVAARVKLRVPASGLMLRLVRYAVIAGTVRDTEGHAVPGRVSLPGGRTGGSARIAVLVKQPGADELTVVRTVPLEDGGTYRIYDLPPGRYAIGLWWGGLPVGSGATMYPDNAHPKFFEVAGGEEYRDIDFLVVAGPSWSVSGKIEGGNAKTQFAIALGLPDLPALPVAELWTEDDGTFRIDKIPPGTYDLFVGGPARGYGAFEAMLGANPVYGRARIQVIGQNVEGVSVPMAPGRSVDVILHGSGEGCPKNVDVTLKLLEPWGLMNTGTGQANFDKPQAVRDLAPGRYSVTPSALGAGCYAVNRPVADLSREVSGPIALELAPAGQIRGTLRAANARDMVVALLDEESSGNSTAQLAFPDEQGRFEFGGLPPGRYRIAAQLGKTRLVADMAKMQEIDVAGGAPTEVELVAPKDGAQ